MSFSLPDVEHDPAVIRAPTPAIRWRSAADSVLIRIANDELAGEGAHLRKRDASISSGLFDQICHSDVLVHSSGPTPRSAIESFRRRIFTLVTADCSVTQMGSATAKVNAELRNDL
jgi:hypothetical protein